MGDMADGILNGDFDEQTGEWLGEGDGYPRTLEPGQYNTIPKRDQGKCGFAKSTKAIRKELAILIKTKRAERPDDNENVIVNECRQEINTKYGKGWREQWSM